jgi:hypothetical protein
MEENDVTVDEISLYASNFCAYISTVESAKIDLYADLTVLSLDEGEDSFTDECYDLITAYEYNYWIDPVIPNTMIKISILCKTIYDLYYKLTYEEEISGTDDFEYYIAKTNQLM